MHGIEENGRFDSEKMNLSPKLLLQDTGSCYGEDKYVQWKVCSYILK